MTSELRSSISTLFPDQPVVEPTQICVADDVASLFDGTLPANSRLWLYSREHGRVTLEAMPSYTAEAWITKRGFGSIRLVTLLDLEAKLRALNLTSPKLAATRQWLDGITIAFSEDQTPRFVWPTEPHVFEDVVQECVGLLLQHS